MKRFSLFMSEEEKWAYIKGKGKTYFLLGQPILLTVFVIPTIFIIRFLISLAEQGYSETLDIMKENYPEKYYPFLMMIGIFWLVMTVTNYLVWIYYSKKENRKKRDLNKLR